MELSQCPRCGAYVIAGRTSGYPVAVNTIPLDAQTLARALVDGRQVYRPRRGEQGSVVGLEWIKPGSQPLDGTMVAEHECGSTVVYRPVKAPVDPPVPVAAPAAPAGVHPASRTHPCDACGKPVTIDGPEEYAAVELGATVVWAVHSPCPGV